MAAIYARNITTTIANQTNNNKQITAKEKAKAIKETEGNRRKHLPNGFFQVPVIDPSIIV